MATATLFEGTRIVTETEVPGMSERFEFHRCGSCGIVWGLPEWFVDERRKDGVGWKCPNGHSFVYNHGKSEEDLLRERLKRERDRAARLTADLDQTKASLTATKGVVTKQRKKLEKVVAGVCPVDGCKRHFKDVRRHIATKHPGYFGQS